VRPLDGVDLRAKPRVTHDLLGRVAAARRRCCPRSEESSTPQHGQIRFGDVDVTALEGRALIEYRRRTVGIVFQAFNLVPSLSALENVMVPMRAARMSRRATRVRGAGAPRTGRPHGAGAPPSRPALGRSAATRGGGARPRRSTRRFCWPTSPPPTSTTSRWRKSSRCFAGSHRESGSSWWRPRPEAAADGRSGGRARRACRQHQPARGAGFPCARAGALSPGSWATSST